MRADRAEDRVPLKVSVPCATVRGAGATGRFIIFDLLISAESREWRIHRRYSDFCKLAAALSKQHPASGLPRLPRKFLLCNLDATAIEARRRHLQLYVQALVADERVRRDAALLDFLGVPRRPDDEFEPFAFTMRSGRAHGPPKPPEGKEMAEAPPGCGPGCLVA